MMNSIKQILTMSILTLPLWAASLCVGQAVQASDKDENEMVRARIGQRTGAKVEVIRPSMLSEETRGAMKIVPADGMIVAIGGHNSMSTDRMLANLALQRVAGMVPDPNYDIFKMKTKSELKDLQKKVRVLVFTQASGEDESRKKRNAGVMFDTAGIPRNNVTVVGTEVTESTPLDGFHLIYLGGGDQNAFMALLSQKAVQDLHDFLNKGGIIAGTSAGAAILSHKMFAGGKEPQDGTLTKDVVEMREGFAFFEAMSLDMHLFEFSRFARAMGALAQINAAVARDAADAAKDGVPKAKAAPIDDVMLSLGQDAIAVIQAVDLSGKLDKPTKPLGAVKVTMCGTTQSWITQCGPNFSSNLTELQNVSDLAEQWDMQISIVAPGSWFVIKW
jgi:cyanophycinase-like exopeptidase